MVMGREKVVTQKGSLLVLKGGYVLPKSMFGNHWIVDTVIIAVYEMQVPCLHVLAFVIWWLLIKLHSNVQLVCHFLFFPGPFLRTSFHVLLGLPTHSIPSTSKWFMLFIHPFSSLGQTSALCLFSLLHKLSIPSLLLISSHLAVVLHNHLTSVLQLSGIKIQ